jgi:NAD(P)-dependent dehydrogenase (short-subunit alcohol dehydrogenase family)
MIHNDITKVNQTLPQLLLLYMKNYVVIGGTSGIGASLVELLSAENNVWFTGTRDPQSLDQVPSTIDHVPCTMYQRLDLTADNPDFSWLPDTIHGIAYCVGAIALKPFHRIKPQEFIDDYNKQTLGAIKTLQAAHNALKNAENSSVVLFSTVAVQTGFPFHTLVSSSKGAIEGLTRALAAEWAPKVRINAIAPSITQTPLAGNLLNSPEKIEANAARHPLKKIGQPQDIAKLAQFLLSEDSSWITGQVHHIDGGISNIKI